MIGLEGALYPWRFRLVLALLALMVGAIAWRMLDLQVLDHDFLKAHGDARSVRHIPIPAHRGLITDRNGEDVEIPNADCREVLDEKVAEATAALGRLLR